MSVTLSEKRVMELMSNVSGLTTSENSSTSKAGGVIDSSRRKSNPISFGFLTSLSTIIFFALLDLIASMGFSVLSSTNPCGNDM